MVWAIVCRNRRLLFIGPFIPPLRLVITWVSMWAVSFDFYPMAALRGISSIQWTLYPQAGPLHYVSVNLCGAHILVAQQILHGANIRSRFQ